MSERQRVLLPNHDTLARLALDAPQSFESLRRELIESCINGAPEAIQLRLRQLQFRIDGIRRLSGSPLGAAIKIQNLMWDAFLRLNDELQDLRAQMRLTSQVEPPDTGASTSQSSAQLIDFPAPTSPTSQS